MAAATATASDIGRAVLHHALRSGFGRQLVTLCDDLLKRRGFDASLVFWRSLGAAREGNLAAAIKDAESLRGRRDADYAALVALATYCRAAKTDDAAVTLASVEGQLAGAVGGASAPALLLAAHFTWLMSDR